MSGFVYFIGPEALLHRRDGTRLVKIGFTRKSPGSRLRALQTGSPLPLKLWAYVEGTETLEAAFHATFAELRSHGEWFRADDKLYDFLSYLGEEPDVGHLVLSDRIDVAIFDCLIPEQPSHPMHDEHLWRLSAAPYHLMQFYPEAFS